MAFGGRGKPMCVPCDILSLQATACSSAKTARIVPFVERLNAATQVVVRNPTPEIQGTVGNGRCVRPKIGRK
jgi:hypothetical protein